VIVIVDYGLGNLASVSNALEKLDIPYAVSDDPGRIKLAQALILPGVGAAGAGMQGLRERGLDQVITDAAHQGTPVLGICLGMQLLMVSSDEDGTECLGLVPGTVKKFQTSLKVPQMGWNTVAISEGSRLLHGITADSYFYFVHSYYCSPDDAKIATGTTDYDGNFCSVFEQGNISGVQFHPEKSGDAGLAVLRNFWEAAC
jgi:imidazole glycerol-phosphate synthase subunit HisH